MLLMLSALSCDAFHYVVFTAHLLQQSSIFKGDRCDVKCRKDRAIWNLVLYEWGSEMRETSRAGLPALQTSAIHWM